MEDVLDIKSTKIKFPIKNTFINGFGSVCSGLLLLYILGYFAKHFSVEEFGVLSLVLSLIAYLTMFDAGFSRAVVREVAAMHNDPIWIKSIVGSASSVVAILSLTFVTALIPVYKFFINPSLFETIELYDVTYNSIVYVTLLLPAVLVTQVWLAFLEGKGYFGSLNTFKFFIVSVSFGTSLLFYNIDYSVTSVVLGVVAGRVIISILLCLYIIKKHQMTFFAFDLDAIKCLYKFGAWITANNFLAPLMDYLDRFVLTVTCGLAGSAYYTPPSEGLQKLQIIPSSISRSIFPQLCKENRGADQLIKKSVYITLFVGLGVVASSFLFGDWFVLHWLGSDYVKTSSFILKILSLAFFFNALAWVPSTALLAIGKAKITVFINSIEILPFIGILFVLTDQFGYSGAAIAVVIRNLIDMVLMFWYYRRVKIC